MMQLLEDILASLEDDAPLTAVHLLPRFIAVAGPHLGLACREQAHAPAAAPPVVPPAQRVGQLAQLALETDYSLAALGIAAINSLLCPPAERLVEGNAYELIFARCRGKDVTVVGHFPFVDRLRTLARNVWVLELNPAEGDLPAAAAPEVLPRSQVVAITGTALINHTLTGLLALCRGAYTVVLGPSTPLTPVLLDHGVNAVCGAVVDDPQQVLGCLGQGQSFRQAGGLRRVILRR